MPGGLKRQEVLGNAFIFAQDGGKGWAASRVARQQGIGAAGFYGFLTAAMTVATTAGDVLGLDAGSSAASIGAFSFAIGWPGR